MKKMVNRFLPFISIFSLIVLFAACSPVQTNQPPETGEKLPSAIAFTPTPLNSAPEDLELDRNCRETINSFFSFRKGFNVQAYRDLFAQSSQHLADAAVNNPPLESPTILALMPVSEWWQKNYPAIPIPGLYLPQEAGEYIYYVEYSGHYGPNETPTVIYPDFITMTMVQEGTSKACKIKNYGKG